MGKRQKTMLRSKGWWGRDGEERWSMIWSFLKKWEESRIVHREFVIDGGLDADSDRTSF